MTDFSDKLRLKEMAEEDIYFAKRDRELIRALHEEKLSEHLKADDKDKEKRADELQEQYARVIDKHGGDPRKLAANYRKLIKKIVKLLRD